ncbi:UNVERIFIED_CONTAM: Pentatricopeptide repeat-containing protein, mitochondrial [Sesamum angustifolium]|uniref:Pentatricopeptide repeat-containing protein, mitochondrial n=1 Tax=Sesamum angustifolium TaxID=2727405 RepID=A0AAW2M8B8_9LAMI
MNLVKGTCETGLTFSWDQLEALVKITTICTISVKCIDFLGKHDADVVIAKVLAAKNKDDVFQSLVHDPGCNTIPITHSLVTRLLHRFQDDWKSALGVFRWVETCSAYKPSPELYDKLVDIMGKMKQLEQIRALLQEMHENHLVSLNTIAKVMRRFAGAGDWRDAVKTFDELENFGLVKNTESMNLLLDTLCKERKVNQAREIFLELKSHIYLRMQTLSIFLSTVGAKINRVEEAQWTIQEMKDMVFAHVSSATQQLSNLIASKATSAGSMSSLTKWKYKDVLLMLSLSPLLCIF